MAMGKRQRSTQNSLFIPTASLARSSSHEFYERLNRVLIESGFDDFVEDLCTPYYVEAKGRRSIPPGTYFRMLLVGYFEGLESERAIDLARVGLPGAAPFPGVRADAEHAGSLDPVSHPPMAAGGGARGSLHLDLAGAVQGRSVEGQDGRRGRHHAGGQRSAAQLATSRYGTVV